MSTFAKLVRIVFLEVVGFQCGSIQNNLNLKKPAEGPESLLDLAFKKYLRLALNSKAIERKLVELLVKESITMDELSYISVYPVLLGAAVQKVNNDTREPQNRFEILFSGVSRIRSGEERFSHISDFDEVASSNLQIVFDVSSIYEDPDHPSPTRLILERLRNHAPSPIPEDSQRSKKKRLRKAQKQQSRKPFELSKKQTKSFYTFNNNKKFNHCRY